MNMMNNLYAALVGKNVDPLSSQILDHLNGLSSKYKIPVQALIALIGAESDFRQFDGSGNPLGNPNSSAVGLGQILKGTAKLYGFDREKLKQDWQYNLDSSVEIYAWGYNHPYIRRNFKDERSRAAAAYDVYHDGNINVFKNRTTLLGASYENRYLSYYDKE